MKQPSRLALGLVPCVCLVGCSMGDIVLAPTYLRTEHRASPLGIDISRPRLSWKVESTQRGQAQTAYRVLVASSPGRAARSTGRG